MSSEKERQDWHQELVEAGQKVGETLAKTPDAGRRAFIGGIVGVLGVQALSDIVAAQDAQPGAACTWLGDQNATGYGLYELGELEFTDGTTLSSGSMQGALTQVATDTVTATGGATPAVETHLDGITDEQLLDYIVIVYVDTDPAFDADYAFNFDYLHYWDNAAAQLDLDLVVNWDTDPGSGNNVTLRWEVLE